jgi:4a-hydroxytetrahydrobiopterin dehydratase
MTAMHLLTASQLDTLDGLDDWRPMLDGLHAQFEAGDFGSGLALVNRIGAIADELNHHPDLDLRYRFVAVSVTTHDAGGVTELDVTFARRVSAAARDLGITAVPARLGLLSIAIDTLAAERIRPFWRAVLGYREQANGDLVDPGGRLPFIWFQKMDQERPQRNRLHLDLDLPPEEVAGRIAAALAAGGVLVSEQHAPAWWVLADADGNELCLCTWQGRD